MRRALSDTSVEVLGIANNRSFMRISDAAIKRVVKANPQQAREVLMHLAMQFAPGTPAHKRRAACAQQIHTRANRLLTKIPRGRT